MSQEIKQFDDGRIYFYVFFPDPVSYFHSLKTPTIGVLIVVAVNTLITFPLWWAPPHLESLHFFRFKYQKFSTRFI